MANLINAKYALRKLIAHILTIVMPKNHFFSKYHRRNETLVYKFVDVVHYNILKNTKEREEKTSFLDWFSNSMFIEDLLFYAPVAILSCIFIYFIGFCFLTAVIRFI